MIPASWVTQHAALLPRSGTALDVACGSGRHALWLAEQGLTVDAIDRDEARIAALRDLARERDLPLTAYVRDLESGAPWLGHARYDVIVVVHYLHRPLFPALIDALGPGGLLIYETFTRHQAARGKPTNPAFLLEAKELQRLTLPLELVEYREGVFDDRDVASIVARRSG